MVDADGLLVEDNIIHGTVDGGIRIKSTGLSLRRNLVSFTMARACYQDRLEADNFFFHGSIEVVCIHMDQNYMMCTFVLT